MWNCQIRLRLCGAVSVEYIDNRTSPSLKSQGDPRVWSRLTRFCRRHSLDELPQCVHVPLRQMSLVGPRPVSALELAEIHGSTAGEIGRVKAGFSGRLQVSSRNRLTAFEGSRLDLECVRKRSLGSCFRILLKTVPEIFEGESAR
jgi:lipopolysaccharide/colanic/teichoic acid biosynthesis glycosyltransferase